MVLITIMEHAEKYLIGLAFTLKPARKKSIRNDDNAILSNNAFKYAKKEKK